MAAERIWADIRTGLLLLLAPLGFLLTIIFIPVFWLISAMPSVDPDNPAACDVKVTSFAPGGKHSAQTAYCHYTKYFVAPNFWSEIRICLATDNRNCKLIFVGKHPPEVEWTDPLRITVTLDGDGTSGVACSLHDAVGIAVAYRATETISDEEFLKKSEDRQRIDAIDLGAGSAHTLAQQRFMKFRRRDIWAKDDRSQACP